MVRLQVQILYILVEMVGLVELNRLLSVMGQPVAPRYLGAVAVAAGLRFPLLQPVEPAEHPYSVVREVPVVH
jgi:hypothetical protein